jgi:hypothetical protein
MSKCSSLKMRYLRSSERRTANYSVLKHIPNGVCNLSFWRMAEESAVVSIRKVIQYVVVMWRIIMPWYHNVCEEENSETSVACEGDFLLFFCYSLCLSSQPLYCLAHNSVCLNCGRNVSSDDIYSMSVYEERRKYVYLPVLTMKIMEKALVRMWAALMVICERNKVKLSRIWYVWRRSMKAPENNRKTWPAGRNRHLQQRNERNHGVWRLPGEGWYTLTVMGKGQRRNGNANKQATYKYRHWHAVLTYIAWRWKYSSVWTMEEERRRNSVIKRMIRQEA